MRFLPLGLTVVHSPSESAIYVPTLRVELHLFVSPASPLPDSYWQEGFRSGNPVGTSGRIAVEEGTMGLCSTFAHGVDRAALVREELRTTGELFSSGRASDAPLTDSGTLSPLCRVGKLLRTSGE